MDTIDALGDRPERRGAFTEAMLAETEDHELQRIVAEAAMDLDTPIALVSLVLDQIQFFKAHYGLPEILGVARGVHRDASFCQFVVRDGQTFKVDDAENDERLPQFLVENYGIRSYLGVPITVGDVTLGSLCVIDTKPRSFDAEDERRLAALAVRVDERLRALTSRRNAVRGELSAQATTDAVGEIRQSLEPMRHALEAGLFTSAALRSFFRLTEHIVAGGRATPNALQLALDAAHTALERHEDLLYNIDAAVADCDDCLDAVDVLSGTGGGTRLSAVLMAAQDLARASTRKIGGAPLPDFSIDPVLSAPKPFAVAITTTVLTQVSQRLKALELESAGIQMRIHHPGPAEVELVIEAPNLPAEEARSIADTLREQLGTDPSVGVDLHLDQLCVVFHCVQRHGDEEE